MKRPQELDRIKLSQKEKDSLVTLKRRTGIIHWNVLCRWAFCLSLSVDSLPRKKKVVADSNLEMSWQTFGGEHEQLLFHLLVERCLADKLKVDSQTLALQFRLHLNRGINYLTATNQVKDIGSLVGLALQDKA